MHFPQILDIIQFPHNGITKIVKGESRIANLFANYAEPHPISD